MDKNMQAGKFAEKAKEDGDIKVRKANWNNSIADYEHYSNERFIHDFFGKMTKEQIGVFAYKHADHQLRQFGV